MYAISKPSCPYYSKSKRLPEEIHSWTYRHDPTIKSWNSFTSGLLVSSLDPVWYITGSRTVFQSPAIITRHIIRNGSIKKSPLPDWVHKSQWNEMTYLLWSRPRHKAYPQDPWRQAYIKHSKNGSPARNISLKNSHHNTLKRGHSSSSVYPHSRQNEKKVSFIKHISLPRNWRSWLSVTKRHSDLSNRTCRVAKKSNIARFNSVWRCLKYCRGKETDSLTHLTVVNVILSVTVNLEVLDIPRKN